VVLFDIESKTIISFNNYKIAYNNV